MPSNSFSKGNSESIARVFGSALAATLHTVRDMAKFGDGFECRLLWKALKTLDPDVTIEVFNTIEVALLESGVVKKSNETYFWIDGKAMPEAILIVSAGTSAGNTDTLGGSSASHDTKINLN